MKDLANLEARSQVQLASHMAGVAFNTAGLGLVHAMGHPLSAVYHQAHGQTLAIMLPLVMDFNLRHVGAAMAAKYARVAFLLQAGVHALSDEENARKAIATVAALSRLCGTAKSISDLGGKPGDIPVLVEQAALDVCMFMTARPASPEQLAQLYQAAM